MSSVSSSLSGMECAPAVRALATSWRKHSFRAESFFGGGLVEDHHDMMLEERIALLKKNIAVSRSSLFWYL